jgi:hypothetical protein
MASDDQIKFSLDLDASGFKEGIEGAKMALEAMAKTSKGLEEVIGSLKGMAVLAASLYGAFKVLQGIVETVFEAENIKAVNQQFEILAKNAGIAGDSLKEGLVEAAGGLIDDTDLLQSANKAIVAMGDSAGKLPQIMELARKATAAFGGDLEQNFQNITQAVSTGNLRMLKQMGIVVDTDEALRKYALTIGRSVSQLTDAERRQATLNAVLEKGKTAFAGISDEIREGQNTWKQIEVIIKQVSETLTLAFEKTFGGTVRKYLSGIKEMAGDTKNFVDFLYGTEDRESKVARVSKDLIQLKEKLINLESGKVGWFDSFFGAPVMEQINKTKAAITAAEAELQGFRQEASKPVEVKGAGAGSGGDSAEARAKHIRDLQLRTQFESDLVKLQEQQLQFYQANATTADQFNQLEIQRLDNIEQRRETELAALDARRQQGLVDEQNFQLQKEQIELQSMERREEMRRTQEQRRMEVYDNELRGAQNVGQGISAAFHQGAAQATADMKNFGKQGQMVFGSFQKNAVSSLQAFGAGTETAAEAAKGFLFGMLADVAEGYGRMMMLTAFESFPAINVPKLAAGAALIALSGYLRSQAAGGKAGGLGGAGAGVGGGGGFGGGAPEQNVAANQQEKKSVTIAIQGNYFDTDQTRTRLLEMIREGTDATDFRYVQIGTP